MSAQVKIEFNSEGFEQILTSEGAGSLCQQQAEAIKARADAGLTADDTPGYATGGKIVTAYGSKRWMYFVHTTDAATMFAEADDQVLSKAVK